MQDWFGTWKRRNERRFGKSRFSKAHLLKWTALLVAGVFVFGVIVLSLMFAWFAKDLPDPNKVVRREGFSTRIVDRDGKLLYQLYTDYNRVPMQISEIPDFVKQGTIAIEDKTFYQHSGFDMFGVLRGFSRIFTLGHAQGGSTLTQQLTKNVLLSADRSMVRKLKELVLSIQIERKFSKDEILQMYLNEAPYGGTAIGIGAAAERYFGKKPNDLTLVESAILSGMPQAPSRYSPYGSDPRAYIARATAVLRRMREDGYISKDQEADSVRDLPAVQFESPTHDIKAPHFVFYVRDELVKLLGDGVIDQGGYTVTTSLDGELQDASQAVVAEEIAKVEAVHITNGAVMVMNPQTGEILSMVGSKNYFDDNYDGKVNVVMSSRQPGSAIKPVTYAAAFANGYAPSSMLLDVPTKFPGVKEGEFYEPKNYDGKFHGPVQLRFTLGSSLNIPAVKLLDLIGLKDMLTLANNMGFSSLAPTPENMRKFGLSVTLGGGEVRLFDLVHAYSAFANGGSKVEPVSILKVESAGKTVYEWKGVQKTKVLDETTAFLINNVLSDNNARSMTFGQNSLLNMGSKPIAVKTGTTNDKRDNWTVGWSTSAVVGVWVGNNDNSQMKSVASGISGASPIWRRIMLMAYDKYKGDEFVRPTSVEEIKVDVISGYPEHDGYPARTDYFAYGTVPTNPDPIHTRVRLCRADTSKLATEIDIARGEYTEQEFYVLNSESTTLWADDIWSWIDSQGESKYKVPREYCSSDTDTVIGFEKPGNQSRVDSNNIEIYVRVTTAKEIEWVKIYKDGTELETFTNKNVHTTITLPDGTYELMAKVKTKDGSEKDTKVKIGVNQAWDFAPSPTASASATP